MAGKGGGIIEMHGIKSGKLVRGGKKEDPFNEERRYK